MFSSHEMSLMQLRYEDRTGSPMIKRARAAAKLADASSVSLSTVQQPDATKDDMTKNALA